MSDDAGAVPDGHAGMQSVTCVVESESRMWSRSENEGRESQ